MAGDDPQPRDQAGDQVLGAEDWPPGTDTADIEWPDECSLKWMSITELSAWQAFAYGFWYDGIDEHKGWFEEDGAGSTADLMIDGGEHPVTVQLVSLDDLEHERTLSRFMLASSAEPLALINKEVERRYRQGGFDIQRPNLIGSVPASAEIKAEDIPF